MPNLTNLLKPGKSSTGGDAKKEKQSSFSLLGRSKDPAKKNNLLQVPELKSPSRSPRIGLFRRCRHGKSSMSLLKTGSQSCIMSNSSTSLSSCGSPLRLAPSDGSSPARKLGGMPKCSTVANFNPVKTTVTTEPQKCCSLSTFAINNADRRNGHFSASSLQNSFLSMAASRCNSKLSCAMSRCCSNASFLPAPLSRNASSVMGEGSGNVALCRLCLCDHPPSDMIELKNCSCRYCRFCLQQYVFFQVMDGRVDITCPDATCERRGAFAKDEIEHLVDGDMYQRYQRFLLNNEVDLDPTRTWCPGPCCETICNLSNGEGSTPTAITCSTCGYVFCSVCKTRWHSNLTCDAYARQRARLSDFEEGLILSDDENASIKRCPICKLLIERDDGCAQMMCKRCKHVFCWYCLASLDDDFLLRHYDKGPCKNKLGHSRASIFWHRTQVVGIFAGFGLLLLMASPFLLLVAPCVLCSNCKTCDSWSDEDSAESPSSSSFNS